MLLDRSRELHQSGTRIPRGGVAALSRLVLVVLIPSFIVFGSDARQFNEPQRLQELRSDYSTGLAQLRSQFAAVSGSGKYTGSRRSGQSVRSTEVHFARKPGSFKYITHDHTQSGKDSGSARLDSALCSSPAISFSLTKNNEAKEFYVSRVEKSPFVTSNALLFQKFIDCAYSMSGYSLPDLLSDPDFILDRAEDVKLNAKTMVKIFFHRKRTPMSNPKILQVLADGWVIASPQDNWATREYEFRTTHLTRGDGSGGSHITAGVIEYREPYSGAPVPMRAEIREFIRMGDREKRGHKLAAGLHDGDVLVTEGFDFETVQFESEPDAAFTLTAFGLPELGAPVSGFRRDYTVVWFFVSAAAFLTAAVALRVFVSWRSRDRGQVSS
jgi:hypothetical protein